LPKIQTKNVSRRFNSFFFVKKVPKSFRIRKNRRNLKKKTAKISFRVFFVVLSRKKRYNKGRPGKDDGDRFPVVPQNANVRPPYPVESAAPVSRVPPFLIFPFTQSAHFPGLFRFEYSRWPRKIN
jgi:hypothetical protein